MQKLHIAAANGFHEIVKCLIDWCPELGILRDLNGDLAIHVATARKDLKCIEHLCTPEVVNVTGESGRTALHYAIAQGDVTVVKYLVEHNADIDARHSHLQDPPLIKALQGDEQDIINVLIDGKADTECMDKRGWRPLHFAARDGYTGLASRLLDLGCERQPQTHLGETPFFLAVAWNRPHIIELFMKHAMGISGVETLEGSTSAHFVAARGRLNTLRELVQMDSSVIFKTTASGVDPLYLAACSGSHAVVDFLIRSGMNPSGMGRFFDTPLAAAAGSGCIKTVDVLLSSGADVNETDAWQRTPLSRAVAQYFPNVAHHLLKAGANPHIRDAMGFSAFDYCVNDSAMMDVLRPWRSIPLPHGMAQNSNERLVRLAQCISRSARAIADRRRDSIYGDFRPYETTWHLRNIRSFLFRLAFASFVPPSPPAQRTLTAVPAKRTEILREWRTILTDPDIVTTCSFCHRTLRREFYACTICWSLVCETCHSQLRLETQPHMRVKFWTELQQLEKDVIPISTASMDLAYQDSRTVCEVLSQDNVLRHWVLAKRQEYAKWRRRWRIHHFQTMDFHGYNLVHTMARFLSHRQDSHMRDDEPAPNALDSEQHKVTEIDRSALEERWQDIFFYWPVDEDLDRQPCTHSSFLKGSKQRESLREPQMIFDATGRLTPETFDKLAQKYEDCLASGDLTFEKLQTTRFTDSIVEPSDNSNNRFDQAVQGERRSGAAADSRDETSSLESASDTTSDVTDASAVSDMEGEEQQEIDVEGILERLLVKRSSLIKEKLLTDENDLVLETAWKLVQAIVYHGTPRQSLRDISEQGSEWNIAPGTPVALGSGGSSNGSSHYCTAASI